MMKQNYILNKDEYLTLKAAWSSKRHHSASDHIIYNVLRGKPIDSGFCIKTHSFQRNDPWNGFNYALASARFLVSALNGSRFQEKIKDTFGIDLPNNISDLLTGYKK